MNDYNDLERAEMAELLAKNERLVRELEELKEGIKAREMLQAIYEPSGIFVKVAGDLGGERLQLWKGGPMSCLQQVGGLVGVMEGVRDFQNSLPYRGEIEIFAVVRPRDCEANQTSKEAQAD